MSPIQPSPEWIPEGDPEVPVKGVVSIRLLTGDDEEDTRLLHEMLTEAEQYLRTFPWCERILSRFFGGGIGGIFAVFLFKIDPPPPGVGPWVWAVVGDVPPSYLPLEDCKSAAEVFKAYMWGMYNWVELARQGKRGTPAEHVPPLDIPATPEWAEKLEHKLQLLTLIVKPYFDETGESEKVN